MLEGMATETWEIWYPKAASTGLSLARGMLDATDVILAHAVPSADLERTQQSPICRLRRVGASVTREDIWPQEADVGLPVLLPGGEVGILKSWWNADDRKEWRWVIELYNSIR
jgi:hypothetical protein